MSHSVSALSNINMKHELTNAESSFLTTTTVGSAANQFPARLTTLGQRFPVFTTRVRRIRLLASTMLKNPFSRLPVEILREILSWAAGRIELYIHQHHYSASELQTPWDLALVCKTWRDVVFSTPCIWSDISLKIIPNKYTGHKYNALLSALKLCLDRSCIHALTIELIISNGGPSSPTPAFVKLLMEHVQQWETVTLRASLDTLLPYLSHSPAQYTRLRRLCIDGELHEREEDWVGLFQDAPLLSHISLNGIPNHSQRLSGMGIPWSQISHLRIDVYSGRPDGLIDILKHTSSLLTLDYSISYTCSGPGGPPILELSQLQRLVWTSYYKESYHSGRPFTSNFFRLLKAPRLSVLEVNGVCGDEEVEAIRGCLQRSNCLITSLDLSTPRLSSLLNLISDIKTLVFTNIPNIIDDNGVKCNDLGDGPLCGFSLAHLQKIKVYLDESHHADGPATLQFFESLEAPKLSVLEINGVCGDRELEAIRGCLQRSRCPVTSLNLSNPRLPSLLTLTPDVETSVLPSLSEGHLMSLLGKLTLDQSKTPCLLPKLRKIVLEFDIPAGPLFDAFIGLLRSRLQLSTNSVARPRCSILEDLELGIFCSMHIRHSVRMRLAPRESLAITSAKNTRLYERWDF